MDARCPRTPVTLRMRPPRAQRHVAMGALLGALLSGGCRSESQVDRGTSLRADEQAVAEPGAESEDWRALYDAWVYPQPIPNFVLTDHTGRPLPLASLADGHVLLGFIYTRCPLPEACPMTTEKMRQVQARWRELAAQGQTAGHTLRLLSVTLDPAHDTPEKLAGFARARGLDTSDWYLATGPDELVQSALPSLFSVLALPRAPGDIQHSVKVALLAPGLRIAKEWPDNAFSVDDVLAEIIP